MGSAHLLANIKIVNPSIILNYYALIKLLIALLNAIGLIWLLIALPKYVFAGSAQALFRDEGFVGAQRKFSELLQTNKLKLYVVSSLFFIVSCVGFLLNGASSYFAIMSEFFFIAATFLYLQYLERTNAALQNNANS